MIRVVSVGAERSLKSQQSGSRWGEMPRNCRKIAKTSIFVPPCSTRGSAGWNIYRSLHRPRKGRLPDRRGYEDANIVFQFLERTDLDVHHMAGLVIGGRDVPPDLGFEVK